MLRGGFAAATLLFSMFCYGQSNLATVNGDVTDPSNRAVPNAIVKLRSNETGAETAGWKSDRFCA